MTSVIVYMNIIFKRLDSLFYKFIWNNVIPRCVIFVSSFLKHILCDCTVVAPISEKRLSVCIDNWIDESTVYSNLNYIFDLDIVCVICGLLLYFYVYNFVLFVVNLNR